MKMQAGQSDVCFALHAGYFHGDLPPSSPGESEFGTFAMTLISSVLPPTAVWEEGEVKMSDPQL